MATIADPLHAEFASWILGFAPYDGGDVGENVRGPTLVLSAEGDRSSTDTDELDARLPEPETRLHFTAAEGAGMHCEMLNRSLANRRILDWLDDTLRVPQR